MGGWTDDGLMDVVRPQKDNAIEMCSAIRDANSTTAHDASPTSHLKWMMVQLVSKQVLENIKKK